MIEFSLSVNTLLYSLIQFGNIIRTTKRINCISFKYFRYFNIPSLLHLEKLLYEGFLRNQDSFFRGLQ